MSSYMRPWQRYLVVVVLAMCLLAPHVPSAYSQWLYQIHVRVVDQYSVDYDGVTVEVRRGELIDSGVTEEGAWSSKHLEGDGRLYDIVVFNGQEKTRTVWLGKSDVYLEFSLERRSPAPTLLVSKVTMTPELVMVGTSFSAELTIQNVGELKSVMGVLGFNITYPFSIVGSGSVIDIGGLEVGNNRTLRSTFSVDSSARTGSYSIPYVLMYSDPNHYTFTSFGKFGVVIHGVPQIQIQDIAVDPTQLNPATDGILTIQLINAGTESALDVTVKILNGQQILANSITYVGLIDRASTKTVIFGIHVSPEADEGIRFLTIEITFRDPAGNLYSLSKNYEVPVYQIEPFIPTDYYFFIAAAVAAVIGVYVTFRRLGIEIW